MTPVRLGTRGSPLALAQAGWVAERLGDAELVPIVTSGDRASAGEQPSGGAPDDKSRFVKELELALLDERIDLAVHSAKDVPGELPDGLTVAGIPAREDPRDALCGQATLAELPDGARVGTASVRRMAQLRAARADLDVVPVRGNVDTRLGKLAAGDVDALVLALAGLRRLDRAGAADGVLDELIPAPGQGALVLEARAGDDRAATLAGGLTDPRADVAVRCERALVAGLDATCHTPVGAHAALAGERLTLRAFVGLPDGSAWIRDELDGDAGDPAGLAAAVRERLEGAGARDLLEAAEAAA